MGMLALLPFKCAFNGSKSYIFISCSPKFYLYDFFVCLFLCVRKFYASSLTLL